MRKAATIPLRIPRKKETTSPTLLRSLPRKATMAKTMATAVPPLRFTPPKMPLVDEADAAAGLVAAADGAMLTLTLTATVEAAVEAVAADGAEASEVPSEAVPAPAGPEVLTTLRLPRTLPLTSPA